MNNILLRIRKVFRDSGKTQTEIGKSISKTSQYVWKLLNDDNANPSDSVIKDICREFNVNEEWLRNGTGEMFVQKTRNQAITDFAADLIIEPESFKTKLIESLAKLEESDWEDIERIVLKLTSDKKKG